MRHSLEVIVEKRYKPLNNPFNLNFLEPSFKALLYSIVILAQSSFNIQHSTSTPSSSRQQPIMGIPSENEDPKVGTLHVEKVSTSSVDGGSEHLEDLDSIEQTQSGKYAWLVAITAGVGGLLFGRKYSTISMAETF